MKKKKMIITAITLIILTLLIFFIVKNIFSDRGEKFGKKDSIKIGISLYKFNDTFISSVRKEIEEYVKDYEKTHKVKLNIEIVDAAGSELTQDRQVDRFISLKYDVICINPVDRTLASIMIDKALMANIPIVFFNRQPVEDDLNRSDKLCYVGAEPKESAVLEGEIIVDEYKKDKSGLDLNGDGVINYVLLEGEPSHQDSLIRTEWSIKTLKEKGVPIRKLTGGIANWDRNQAAALVEEWIKKYGHDIELVISNNDDMALGAIDVLKSVKGFEKVKVVGIDGTKPALEALKERELLGTVTSDKKEYARAIVEFAVSKVTGKELPDDIKNKLLNNKYYNAKQYKVTSENVFGK